MFLALPVHKKDRLILILVESFSFSFEKPKRKAEKKGSKCEHVPSRRLSSDWGDVGGKL